MYRKLRAAGLTVIVHVILGLPGESREDMLSTVRYLAGLVPVLQGVKLQLLHILRGTQMAEEYAREPFPLLSLEEYTELIVDCLRILPPETVIHRMTGDGPKALLIAPLWSGDKKRVLNYLSRELSE
jgi:radical SAM superfamily enzyme